MKELVRQGTCHVMENGIDQTNFSGRDSCGKPTSSVRPVENSRIGSNIYIGEGGCLCHGLRDGRS